MAWTLAQLAERVGGEVVGDAGRAIAGIRTLRAAGPEHLAFLTSGRYLAEARTSRAGALLVGARHAELAVDQLVVPNAPAALARLIELFHPAPVPAPGVHPTGVVDADARVDPSAHVGPYAVVEAGATVGEGAVIHAHAVVGRDCRVGPAAVLHPHVVLYAGVALGERAVVHAGSVIGADGFGYATERGAHLKIPQVGGVEIGADVEIGALSAVDRATLDATTIGAGTKIDNLVQVGHNVRVGRNSILCGQAGIAGSAELGDGVVLGGQAGVAGHLRVGDRVQVASKSAVYEEVAPGEVVAGIPAVPIGRWRRRQALVARLEEIWRRLRALERGRAEPAPAEDGEESR
jgi:UDP-3-O-[3-hydroxymyristoyl] glucosamine N-acyltransferase